MAERISVGLLVRYGILRIGDYVDYEPDKASYVAEYKNTGYYGKQIFDNARRINWVVVYVERKTGEALIMPEEALVKEFYLAGNIGYLNGPKELNCICEALGSNVKLGAKARCINVDDANKITAYRQGDYAKIKKRYAFYPTGTIVDGNVIYYDNTYIKMTHSPGAVRFYESDAGGKIEKDENGLTYRVPEIDNPVLVTESYYEYIIRTRTFESSFWLASQCVSLHSNHADFLMFRSSKSVVTADTLCTSDGFRKSLSYGVYPIVTLASNIQMYIDVDNSDVRTSKAMWKFAV